MSSLSGQHLQDTREDENVTSPSESTTSLLGNYSANSTSRTYERSGALSGLNIIVTCKLHDKPIVGRKQDYDSDISIEL